MAKKKPKGKQSKVVKYEDGLPQNIISFGEHVVEDKNIYISQSAYKDIHKFTKDKTTNESGGVLLGKVIEEVGKTNIIIYAFIEGKYSEGTPTTLTFTHETWEYIHKEANNRYPDLKILGWIHTHPNFGIFLSEYDKFIQQNFFGEENQIAYVVDPIQHIEGFYFWINEKIERCKGFYVFDKTGTEITVGEDDDEEESKPASSSLVMKILMGVLFVVVALLVVICISLSNQIKALEKRMDEYGMNGGMNMPYYIIPGQGGNVIYPEPYPVEEPNTQAEENGQQEGENQEPPKEESPENASPETASPEQEAPQENQNKGNENNE